MENRAYSVLEIRSLDSEKRTFSGWATTPAVDRVGDIIEPKGLTFAEKTPLLLHHNHQLPAGWVKFGKPEDLGVPFEAEIPEVKEAGTLKDRVDEAWHSVKYGVITAVSVGFRALEGGVERMKEGGLRFTKAELLELSLVAVPANSQAVITAIKSFDQQHLPASGHEGVSGDTVASVEAIPVVRLNEPKPPRKHQIVEITK